MKKKLINKKSSIFRLLKILFSAILNATKLITNTIDFNHRYFDVWKFQSQTNFHKLKLYIIKIVVARYHGNEL